MMSFRALRDTSLATLLIFSSGCFIHCGSYQTAPPQHRGPSQARPRPKPAAKPQRPPSKPKPPASSPHPQPKPQPKPQPRPQPRPQPQPRPDPAPGQTQIVVPVRVDFAEAVERVDAMIQKTMTQDWTTVSAKGAAVKIDVRYKVWRDPLKASFSNGTLKVEARVRYAADVRASARNPVGGGTMWITRGTTWGTASDPQVLTAKLHAKFSVQDDYSVKADVGLDDIDHGPAPTGKICVGKLVKVCMNKEQAAPQVRKNIEAQVIPRIEKALGDADKQIEKTLRLKKQAETLWSLLQQPQAIQKPGQSNCPSEVGSLCSTPAWLVARPTSIGVEGPRMDGKDLRVDIGVGGKLSVALGERPAVRPAPLPKLQRTTADPGFAVHAGVRVPLATLSQEIQSYLRGQTIGAKGTPELEITKVAIQNFHDPRFKQRIRIKVSVRGGMTADLEVQGELAWDTRRGELSLKNLDYTLDTDNEALKNQSAANHDALLRLIQQKARWKIGTRTAALGKAITGALGQVWPGHLGVDGELKRVSLERFTVDKDVLEADVVLAGQLGVSFKP